MVLRNWLSSLARTGATLNPRLQALRQRLLNDPYYRLQSGEEIEQAAALGLKIDANLASVDDWLRLPGLSIHQARLLVELAQSGVQFYCLEDIAAALGIPVSRLAPLTPVLGFHYYDEESVCTVQPIDVNTASIEMLTRIPALDLFLARAIVNHRRSDGPYRSLSNLQKRLYLPGDLIAEIMHYLRF